MIHEDKKDATGKKVAKKTFAAFNPKKYINVNPELKEAVKKDLAVISFGRMNPITVGHEKLANKIAATAIKLKGDPLIFLSHTQDKKKNPLSYDDKIKFAQKAFGKMVVKSAARQIIEVSAQLQNSYNNLVMVVGDDRVTEFERILNKYNGKEFTFDSIKVISAGQRDPDAEGVEGMSASKMRALAVDDDMEEFKKGLPRKLQSSAGQVFDAVRNGMGLSEDYELDEEDELEEDELDEAELDNQQRRKRAMTMRKNAPRIARAKERASKRKANPEKLRTRANKAALSTLKKKVSAGKDTSDMSTAQKNQISRKIDRIPKGKLAKLAKKLLPSIRKKEKERFANRNKKESADYMFENYMTTLSMLESKMADLEIDLEDMTDAEFKKEYKATKKEMLKSISESSMADLEIDLEDMTDAEFKKEYKATKKEMRAKMDESYQSLDADCNLQAHAGPKKKRFHMLLNKNNTTKIDKRFKMYKKKPADVSESLYDDEIYESILELEESVESYMNDADVNEKFQQFMEKKSGAGEEGTDELLNTYKKDTPKGCK